MALLIQSTTESKSLESNLCKMIRLPGRKRRKKERRVDFMLTITKTREMYVGTRKCVTCNVRRTCRYVSLLLPFISDTLLTFTISFFSFRVSGVSSLAVTFRFAHCFRLGFPLTVLLSYLLLILPSSFRHRTYYCARYLSLVYQDLKAQFPHGLVLILTPPTCIRFRCITLTTRI